MWLSLSLCWWIHVSLSVYPVLSADIHVAIWGVYPQTYNNTHINTRTHAHTHTHAHTYKVMYAHTRMLIHAFSHTCTHTHTHSQTAEAQLYNLGEVWAQVPLLACTGEIYNNMHTPYTYFIQFFVALGSQCHPE